MGVVPTSEVGYTIATTRRETTKVHKNMCWHCGGGGGILPEAHLYNISGLQFNIILTTNGRSFNCDSTPCSAHTHFIINTTSRQSALCVCRCEDQTSYRFLFNGDEHNKSADTLQFNLAQYLDTF